MPLPWLMVAQLAGAATENYAPLVGQALAGLKKENRAEKKDLRKDIDAMEKGELGYSEAQKRQMQADALDQAREQSSSYQDAIQRTAAAQGGQSGSTFAAMQAANVHAQDVAGAVGAQVQQLSDQQAARRRAEVQQRMAVAAQRNRDNGKAWGKATGDTAGDFGKILGGGSAGSSGSMDMSAFSGAGG